MTAMPRPRHAIYFAPPSDGPLWSLASAIIGWDAAAARALPFPDSEPCNAADWPALTAEPRRYGFHATLKAPFELDAAADEAMLIAAARAFAATRRPFDLPQPTVATLGSFVAVQPGAASAELASLAADAVVAFEPFRAPLAPADLARRLAANLTERQAAAVHRWGYPYVFEDFRFHMTLTGPLPAERRESVRAALAELLGDTIRPLTIDALAIFRQDDRDGPFHIVERCPFGARAPDFPHAGLTR
ncbi:DUF1045 domain-containing protein [Siculibacillus lacustris]|uniref:DUF1045 domain-containing protein n=1 Tax=Siculibacillus lacustris TaxID=1549641 RepID=A0A4Q9VPD4_9HYPH|nr:DUF1045 domain-containing protein [Siculibacillus lacustris]TBW37598.1 DUF1045 domain-containing protein [Siculibacillus lacustris]